MARSNRGDIFNPAEIGLYYCSNYCGGSRRICAEAEGVHGRRQWMFEMLQHFAQHFAIDIIGYCIQEDAFHLVLRNRPDIAEKLRDDQAARAWLMLCPKSQRRSFALPAGPPTDEEVNQLLWLPGAIQEVRTRLSDPSWLCGLLSQRTASLCNMLDNQRGHLWEGRFHMDALTSEMEVLACLTHVDLQPLQLCSTSSVRETILSSLQDRDGTTPPKSADKSFLAPLELCTDSEHNPPILERSLSSAESLDQGELTSASECVVAASTAENSTPLPKIVTRAAYGELIEWLAPQLADLRRSCLSFLGLNASRVASANSRFARLVESAAEPMCEQTNVHPEILAERSISGFTFLEAFLDFVAVDVARTWGIRRRHYRRETVRLWRTVRPPANTEAPSSVPQMRSSTIRRKTSERTAKSTCDP